MTTYAVYLEASDEALAEGGYLAHVPAVPGCTGRGATKDEAVARCREELGRTLDLLRRNGLLPDTDDESVELEVREIDQPTLPTDFEPLTDAELADLPVRAAAMREELLAFIDQIPEEALDWSPDEESWPMRWVIAHLSSADLWYGSRMSAGGTPELKWRLQATRQQLLDRVAELGRRADQPVTQHDGEEWTPRKAARRMLEHEREHLAHLKELLAAYQAHVAGGE